MPERQKKPEDKAWGLQQNSLSELSGTIAETRERLQAVEDLADPMNVAAAYVISCGQFFLPNNPRMARAVKNAGSSVTQLRRKFDDYHALARLAVAMAAHCIVLQELRPSPDPEDLAAVDLLSCGLVHLSESSLMKAALTAAGLWTTKRQGRRAHDHYRALLDLACRVAAGEQERPASREAAKLVSSVAGVSLENIADVLRTKFRADKVFYLQQVAKASDHGESLDSLAKRMRANLERPVIALGSSGVEVHDVFSRRHRQSIT